MRSNIVGLLTLLAEVLIVTVIMATDGSAYIMAGFIFLALAFFAIHVWQQFAAFTSPRIWLILTSVIPLVGAAIFLVDGLVGQVFHPQMGFVEGAFKTGMFGGILTAISTVGLEAIGVAGLVRSFFVEPSISVTQPNR